MFVVMENSMKCPIYVCVFFFQFSVNKKYSTFGQQLLSVKYGGEFNKNKAYLFALLTVGSKYLKQRSHEVATAARNPTVSEKVSTVFIFFILAFYHSHI
jgi:hypothetical protein